MNIIFENKYLTLKPIDQNTSQMVYCAWKDFWEEFDQEILLALDTAQ